VRGLGAKGTPLRSSSEGASCLHNVAEASSRRHEHSIDIHLAEEGSGNGDSGRDSDFGGLAKLALVAGSDVLCNIMSNRRPPKAI